MIMMMVVLMTITMVVVMMMAMMTMVCGVMIQLCYHNVFFALTQ